MTGQGPSAPASPRSPHQLHPGLRDGTVVFVALLLGLLIWRVTGEASSPGRPGRLPASFTSSTTTPERPPTGVRVLVLNGSGRANRARVLSERLAGAGYRTLAPGNAPRQPATVVHFRPDFAREAGTLSRAAQAGRAEPLLPLDRFPGADNADCVVIIGSG